jgi:ribosomal protein S18 acetylase RimI-like enzyme
VVVRAARPAGYEREAYIHFLGVVPELRGTGLAHELYTRFFALAAAEGRTTVSAVTSPTNTGSIAFHHPDGVHGDGARWRTTTARATT